MLESGFIGFLVAVPCKVREWMIKESHFDRRTHFVVLGKTPPPVFDCAILYIPRKISRCVREFALFGPLEDLYTTLTAVPLCVFYPLVWVA